MPLLDDSPIDEVVPVYNQRGNKVGEIIVKLYWYDVNVQKDMRKTDTQLTSVRRLSLKFPLNELFIIGLGREPHSSYLRKPPQQAPGRPQLIQDI